MPQESASNSAKESQRARERTNVKRTRDDQVADVSASLGRQGASDESAQPRAETNVRRADRAQQGRAETPKNSTQRSPGSSTAAQRADKIPPLTPENIAQGSRDPGQSESSSRSPRFPRARAAAATAATAVSPRLTGLYSSSVSPRAAASSSASRSVLATRQGQSPKRPQLSLHAPQGPFSQPPHDAFSQTPSALTGSAVVDSQLLDPEDLAFRDHISRDQRMNNTRRILESHQIISSIAGSIQTSQMSELFVARYLSTNDFRVLCDQWLAFYELCCSHLAWADDRRARLEEAISRVRRGNKLPPEGAPLTAGDKVPQAGDIKAVEKWVQEYNILVNDNGILSPRRFAEPLLAFRRALKHLAETKEKWDAARGQKSGEEAGGTASQTEVKPT